MNQKEELALLYDGLLNAKRKWQTTDYSSHTQKTRMEFLRDNDLQFIDQLIAEYEKYKNLDGRQQLFAANLIKRSNR